jgi:hypothetical protein
VDLRVWADPDGTVYVQSVGCEIRGVEYINQRFKLNLVGKLEPQQLNGKTVLQGRADLEVQVDVPSPLDFTPKPFLEATGNGLLKSVLLTVKQRLMHHLLADYSAWASSNLGQAPAVQPSVAPTNNPIA